MSLNRYTYGNGDPMEHFDPDGRLTMTLQPGRNGTARISGMPAGLDRSRDDQLSVMKGLTTFEELRVLRAQERGVDPRCETVCEPGMTLEEYQEITAFYDAMHQSDLAYDARMRAIKDRNRGGGLVSFGKELLPGVDCIRMVTDGPTVGNAAGCAMDAVPAAGAAKRLVKGARAVKDLDNAADGTRAADRAADARRGFGAAPGAKGDDVAATAASGKGYANRTPAQATANLERIRSSAKPTAGRSPKLARPSPRSQGDSVRTAHGAPAPRATSLADDGLALCRSNSFIPATLVLMGDGTTKPIADVRVGDVVMAADPETGERGPRRVTDTTVGHGVKELVDIEIDGNIITATDRHPFWIDDEGRWVDAEDLEPGDVLLRDDGDTVTVDSIRERTEVRRVHNLTVDGIHTYYVLAGDDAVLVHNCITTPNVSDPKLGNYVDQLYKHANRPGTIGNGTTMDAIRAEIAAGGGRHIQKGEEIARGLNRWLGRNSGASYSDRLVARSLYDELVDSLGYAP